MKHQDDSQSVRSNTRFVIALAALAVAASFAGRAMTQRPIAGKPVAHCGSTQPIHANHDDLNRLNDVYNAGDWDGLYQLLSDMLKTVKVEK